MDKSNFNKRKKENELNFETNIGIIDPKISLKFTKLLFRLTRGNLYYEIIDLELSMSERLFLTN